MARRPERSRRRGHSGRRHSNTRARPKPAESPRAHVRDSRRRASAHPARRARSRCQQDSPLANSGGPRWAHADAVAGRRARWHPAESLASTIVPVIVANGCHVDDEEIRRARRIEAADAWRERRQRLDHRRIHQHSPRSGNRQSMQAAVLLDPARSADLFQPGLFERRGERAHIGRR